MSPTYEPAPVTLGRATAFLGFIRSLVEDATAPPPDEPVTAAALPGPVSAADQVRSAEAAAPRAVPSLLSLFDAAIQSGRSAELCRIVVARVGEPHTMLSLDEADEVPAAVFAEALPPFVPASSQLTTALIGGLGGAWSSSAAPAATNRATTAQVASGSLTSRKTS